MTRNKNIDTQIHHYVSGLSAKNKKAVLTVVKNMAESEKEVAFEKKWAEGISLEDLRNDLLQHVRSLEWKQKKS